MEEQTKADGNLALLGTAHSLNHSLFLITSPLLSLIMFDLGASQFEIGTVSTAASMIYGAGALAGSLGDRIGEVKAITICLALSGLSAPLMLLSSYVSGLYVYAVGLMLMAVWASLYHPIANSFISKVFKVRTYEAMGLHGVGGTLGTVLTPTVAYFLGVTFGWPWAFVFFGTLSVIVAIVFARKATRPEKVKNHGGARIFEALRIRGLGSVLILNVAIGLFMKSVELFFPTYLKDNRGIDPFWASVAFTLLLAVGVPGQWIGSKAAHAIGPKKVLIITMTGVCASLLSLLYVPVYIVGIAAFIGLYGLSFYSHQPALNALTGFLAPYEQRSAVFGIYFFSSFGVGSISQLISGYLADVYGLDLAFILLTVFAAVALILSFRLPERSEKNREDREKEQIH